MTGEGSDTLLLVDSTLTNEKGKFSFLIQKALDSKNPNSDIVGLYKVVLQRNQFFYILNDGNQVEIKTIYIPDAFYNIATDSLIVLKSDENKRFYQFQQLQMSINIANGWLLQMMRLYPLPDPFHKNIEDEYDKRYRAMDQFVKAQNSTSKVQNLTTKIALAYYIPVNPDWKEPDQWRDSVIATHYFDYFNPADSFYLNTNILSEKMDMYLSLRTNRRDNYGQPIYSEQLFADAAIAFLEETKTPSTLNEEGATISSFCLNYYLKKFNLEHKENAFLSLYDRYLSTPQGDCGSLQIDEFYWARKKADFLRNVQIGSIAPDFEIEKGIIKMSSLQSDYTLLVFWATWCPHCTQEIPEIKKVTDKFNIHPPSEKSVTRLATIAISLDTDNAVWHKFVQENNLLAWLNTSELKGWNGEVPKKYNVYATPTMFLLDKDKKIIAKPESATELSRFFNANNLIDEW